MTINRKGHLLHRIKALKSFLSVNKGDLGGWVENKYNLSQTGTCWIYDDAKVYDGGYVCENGSVRGRAEVYNYGIISDCAAIFDDVQIDGADIKGFVKIFDKIKVTWNRKWNDQLGISDNLLITGDAVISKPPIVIKDTTYTIIITDEHMIIDQLCLKIDIWQNISNTELLKKKNILTKDVVWWNKNKFWIMGMIKTVRPGIIKYSKFNEALISDISSMG